MKACGNPLKSEKCCKTITDETLAVDVLSFLHQVLCRFLSHFVRRNDRLMEQPTHVVSRNEGFRHVCMCVMPVTRVTRTVEGRRELGIDPDRLQRLLTHDSKLLDISPVLILHHPYIRPPESAR